MVIFFFFFNKQTKTNLFGGFELQMFVSQAKPLVDRLKHEVAEASTKFNSLNAKYGEPASSDVIKIIYEFIQELQVCVCQDTATQQTQMAAQSLNSLSLTPLTHREQYNKTRKNSSPLNVLQKG